MRLNGGMANSFGVPVGWSGGTGLDSVEAVRTEARYASELGVDTFWVSQIFGVDPIVALAAVAGDLTGVPEVGTSVVPLYGRHPLALAAQARTAQSAIPGTFTLGIGPSHAMVVEGFYGESYDRPYSHTAEYVEAINPLLAGQPTDVEGTELTAKGWLTVDADPVPLVIAAMGRRMLELAGRATAGTMLGFPVGARTIADHIAPTINQAAADAGAPPPRVIASVAVAITDQRDEVLESSRAANAMYSDLPAYRAMLEREGVESPANLVVVGSEAEVHAGVMRFVEAGATEVRLGVAGPPDIQAATRDGLPSLLAP